MAIDPKGVVGEVELELAAALRNPMNSADLHGAAAIDRRVTGFQQLLRIDRQRVLGWTFAQAVLSAIWMVQDNGKLDAHAPAMRVAEAARSFARMSTARSARAARLGCRVLRPLPLGSRQCSGGEA